jgi:hypothetical protein
VINPQNGHFLCAPYRAICGFTLRIQWSNRIVKSTISRPKKILVAFIKAKLLGVLHQTAWADRLLAEKPKVENFRWTGLGQKA